MEGVKSPTQRIHLMNLNCCRPSKDVTQTKSPRTKLLSCEPEYYTRVMEKIIREIFFMKRKKKERMRRDTSVQFLDPQDRNVLNACIEFMSF